MGKFFILIKARCVVEVGSIVGFGRGKVMAFKVAQVGAPQIDSK